MVAAEMKCSCAFDVPLTECNVNVLVRINPHLLIAYGYYGKFMFIEKVDIKYKRYNDFLIKYFDKRFLLFVTLL